MTAKPATDMHKNLAILRAGNVDAYCQPGDYPISRLLFASATDIASTPINCIAALGLGNKRQTAKRLNRWIAEAQGHHRMLHAFAQAACIMDKLTPALEATSQMRKLETKARLLETKTRLWQQAAQRADRFQPFLFVIPQASRPRTIFIEAFTGGSLRMLRWESHADESVAAARSRAGHACRQHYREHAGQCRNWGAVKMYCLAEAWNSHCLLDKDGGLLQVVPEPVAMQQATLSVGKKSGLEKMLGTSIPVDIV